MMIFYGMEKGNEVLKSQVDTRKYFCPQCKSYVYTKMLKADVKHFDVYQCLSCGFKGKEQDFESAVHGVNHSLKKRYNWWKSWMYLIIPGLFLCFMSICAAGIPMILVGFFMGFRKV